jgi:hypothetical protein
MRFRLRSLFLITALVAVGLMLHRWWPVDGFGGIIAVVWGDNTVWAPGYTDAGFREVRIGMKRSEVHALLGEPLESHPQTGGEVIESWTTMGTTSFDCSIHFRCVTFKGDVVVEKVAEFSPD